MAKAKKLAGELTKFLKDNNLTVEIAGKNYVPLEGWQFLGETQMQLTSLVTECERVDTAGTEVRYRAVAEIMNQQGTVISRGFAWCSDKEKKKKSYEEYAVASMAQTRAIGKAYRTILSWIVKLGGYEPTPAEEMDSDSLEKELAKIKSKVYTAFTNANINDTAAMVDIIQKTLGKDTIDTVDDANAIFNALDNLKKDEEAQA